MTSGINAVVFDNPTFVDSGGSVTAESDNVQAALASFGHAVTTTTALDAAGLTAALSGQDVFAVPEFESGTWLPDAAAGTVIENFVISGGTLIKFGFSGNNAGFLNTVFGFSLEEFSGSTSTNQNVVGGLFEGAPATLPSPSGTDGLSLASLPTDAIAHYVSGVRAPVVELPVGEGRIIYLGFDWFRGAPVGSSDGGWLDVLEIASSIPAGDLRLIPDRFTTDEVTNVSGNVFADNGLGADSQEDGLPFEIVAVEGSAANLGTAFTLPGGTMITMEADGTFDYQIGTIHEGLRGGETLDETILYQVSDGIETRTTALTIEIIGSDRFTISDDAFTTDDVIPITGNVFADNGNGADVHLQGGTITVTAIEGVAADVGVGIVLGSGATMTLGADGALSVVQDPSLQALVAGVTRTDQVTYTVSDGIETVDVTLDLTFIAADNNDVFRGNGLGNRINAGLGDDIILGFGGNDILRGEDGDDTVNGGSGNDKLIGEAGNDLLIGLAGDDVLIGGADDDILSGGEGNDRLIGGDGADQIRGFTGDDFARGGADADIIAGHDGNDVLAGDGGTDTIVAGDGDDILLGGLDADRLVGNAGDDRLLGEDGNDTAVGGDGADVLRGDGGEDRLVGDAGNDRLLGGADNDILLGGLGDDRLLGEDGDDFMLGGRDFDVLSGGAGNDRQYGGIGDDFLDGGMGNDRLFGGRDFDRLRGREGDDFLTGEIGDDFLAGGSGNDRLFGGRDFDILRGQTGDDLLDGGLGSDTLTGGAGADTFVIRAGDGDDTITDFNALDDRLLISGFGPSVDTLAEVLVAIVTPVGAELVIDFGQGDQLTLVGASIGDLNAMTVDFA